MKISNPSELVIEVNGLAKRFNREWIFRKLTYTFQSGRTYAITGPNGSGKSTLLQVLWGQSPPTAGTITYKLGDAVIPVENYYQHLSIATPYMDLVDEFTLEEQIQFHRKLRPLRNDISTDELVDKMYLGNSRTKQIGNFSSGMRQRVKLCLAFATQANVIFLDEPGTNLDKAAFSWYQTQLAEIDASTTVFIASNEPEEYKTAHETLNILDFKQ